MAKILIVEDEATLIKNLRLAFDQHEVIDAQTGEQGIAMAEEHQPDIILLDLILPKMNGIDVLKILKKNDATADIPVIVLTNVNDSKMISEIVAAGGKDYFVKTDWSLDDLVLAVERHIS